MTVWTSSVSQLMKLMRPSEYSWPMKTLWAAGESVPMELGGLPSGKLATEKSPAKSIFWARRMDEQVSYVGRTAPLKLLPSEQFQAGRVFCNIEAHEHEPMFKMVTESLGDGVLMYASDYPHSECQFPESVDNILAWKSLKPETQKKLLGGNADRFFKQT